MKKLLIKASGITNPSWRGYNSGVGRSTYMLLNELSKRSINSFEIEIYVNGISSINFNFYHWNFKYSKFPVPDKIGCYYTNIEAFYRCNFKKYDLLHIPHNIDKIYKNENYVVTIHDIIAYKQTRDNKIKKKWIEMAKNSRAIVTCSHFSKQDIINDLNIDPDKIFVIPWGIDREKFFIKGNESIYNDLKIIGIHQPYFLAVSCSHPRKNIYILLKAFSQFCVSKINQNNILVLVWNNPPKELLSEFSNEIKHGKIRFINYVDDSMLVSLYNGATATFFPSRYEGFGFPILESIACGTPIVTCKNSSLPEVGGDLAQYIDEDSIDDIVDYMKMFENNDFNIIDFRLNSESHLENFSWNKTAIDYIKFYEKHM